MMTLKKSPDKNVMHLPLFIMISLLLLTSTVLANNANDDDRRADKFNLDNGVALDGYDPVSYFTNDEPLEGSSDITLEYQGVTYHFATEENRDTFNDNPGGFEPKYGGYCAYTMLDGELQSVNPEIYKIVDDQLLLFYRMRFGIVNALNRWNDKAEETEGGDQALMEQAGEHWTRIFSE